MKSRRSYIFQAYNKARRVANAQDHGFEVKRLHRALGIAFDPHKLADKVRFYGTTKTNCNCPDRRKGRYCRTSRVCKHMMAIMITERAVTYAEKEMDRVQARNLFYPPARQKLGTPINVWATA